MYFLCDIFKSIFILVYIFKEYVFVDEVLLNIGRDCCFVLVLMSPFTNKRLEQAHGLHHSFEVTALYVFQKFC